MRTVLCMQTLTSCWRGAVVSKSDADEVPQLVFDEATPATLERSFVADMSRSERFVSPTVRWTMMTSSWGQLVGGAATELTQSAHLLIGPPLGVTDSWLTRRAVLQPLAVQNRRFVVADDDGGQCDNYNLKLHRRCNNMPRIYWPRMNLSGYVGYMTMFSWMFTIACCLVVGLGLGLDLVSGL